LHQWSLLTGSRQHAMRGAQLRPIITGCLKACGVQDQTCATQCQVCVEMRGCKTLAAGDCGTCRAEVRAALRWSETVGDSLMDSGGQALLRDGVRLRLQHARLTALDAKRRLRRARGGILNAQRQAEWAADEHENEVTRLHESQSILRHKEHELEEWQQEHAQRLEAMRKELAKRREEVNRTKQHRARAKQRLFKMRRRLARAEGQRRESWQRLEAEAERSYERWHKRLKEERQAMKHLKQRLRKHEDNAEWIEEGLNREIREAQNLVDGDLRKLREARSMEELSRGELENAKQQYREAAVASQQRDTVAARLQERLAKFALTTTLPDSDW